MSACLVIDIGNTSTSLGRYENGAVTRVSTIHGGIIDPLGVDKAVLKAGAAGVERAIVASVVPEATPRWEWFLRRLFNLESVLVGHRTPMPIGIRYPDPAAIGADRLANACGAAIRYGAPAIVADFGTALTFDILNADREYIGGVIAPGLPLMTEYLYEKTALLPRISLGDGPPQAIGTDTESAMRIGALVGYRGVVREVVAHLARTVGEEARLCATGGYARWALEGFDMPFAIDPDLTLFGLGAIHDTI